ncbi:MAG: hypothetical protein AAGH83_03565 [Pseudomonadota bacterium]
MTTHAPVAATLGTVSKDLQALHRQLLRFQADQVGFDGTPLQLFDRATKDTGFAWLKPLRDAIVALDDRRAEKEPLSAAETKAYGDRFRDLIDAETGPFRDKLNIAFQSDPEVIIAVSTARKSLAELS